MKFLILLAYYKRPILVLNALTSIKKSTYDNWHLAFIDDSGDECFKEKLFSFGLNNSKITYYPIGESEEHKVKQGGSTHGKYINKAIQEIDSDVAIFLCDDDALTHNYLWKLNKYFVANLDVNYCYSKVLFYNPNKESYVNSKTTTYYRHPGSTYNINHNVPLNPFCRLDASQVAWRTKCNKEYNIWFPYPKTKNLDAALFIQLYEKFGNCQPTGFYGQCKGAFEDHLGNRKIIY